MSPRGPRPGGLADHDDAQQHEHAVERTLEHFGLQPMAHSRPNPLAEERGQHATTKAAMSTDPSDGNTINAAAVAGGSTRPGSSIESVGSPMPDAP
jgi:hypothetical protein